MYRIVLDTNVYISALLRGGKPEIILKCSHNPYKYELCTSIEILKELDRDFREKFFWSPVDRDKVTRRISYRAEVVKTTKSISAIAADEKDDRILECAIKAKADYIVSGDKHLLDLKQYKGIKILKPAQFLTLLEKER